MPRSILTAALVALALGSGAAACESRPAPKMVAKKDDGVPVNSAAEERLNGTPKPKPAASASAAPPLPAPPVAPEPTATPAPVEPTSDPPGDAKLTKAECKKLLERYVTLTISKDKRFPPEMTAQMKASALAQAKLQKGDACSKDEVSRSQYTCAMASTSTAAWARCMK